MKLGCVGFVVALALSFSVYDVEAQSRSTAAATSKYVTFAPWDRGCQEYDTDMDFVRSASMYCLRQQNQKICHSRAAEVFARCGFSTSYVKLSKRVYAKMLVVWALAGAQRGAASGTS